MAKCVELSIEDGLAEVRLNRPERLNALDAEMCRSLSAIIVRLARAENVNAVILHGEGRGFCAGLDLAAMAAGGLGLDLSKREFGIANAIQHVAWGWRTLPMPVIAAVHGAAFGAGLQIVSGADIRIGRGDARLSIRETAWGLIPDMAGIALWRTYVRGDVLRELTFSAREFSGQDALSYGFLTSLSSTPLDAARNLARAILNRSPDAVAAAKRLLNLAADTSAAEILLEESREQLTLKGSENQREAVNAAIERRAPAFRSR